MSVLNPGAKMKRREFLMVLGGAVGWPLAAQAQPTGKLPTIGFLDPTASSTQGPIVVSVFSQRLRELGWLDGRNIRIEVRLAEGRRERYAEIAAEFIRLPVDVIDTYSVPAIIATKQATSTIPIVFATSGDPVGNGLVTSLARPGGNLTGMSNQSADLVGKRIELLRELVPSLHRLAIMTNVSAPNAVRDQREVEATARSLRVEAVPLQIRTAASHPHRSDPAYHPALSNCENHWLGARSGRRYWLYHTRHHATCRRRASPSEVSLLISLSRGNFPPRGSRACDWAPSIH